MAGVGTNISGYYRRTIRVDIVDSDIFGLHPNGISQEPPTDKLIDFEEYEGGCRRGGQKVNKISGNAQQQGRGQ